MAEQMMQETAGKAIPAGYKQTEVGVIPEDWDVCLLKNICSSFKTGKLGKVRISHMAREHLLVTH